jgi:hypothetical protein
MNCAQFQVLLGLKEALRWLDSLNEAYEQKFGGTRSGVYSSYGVRKQGWLTKKGQRKAGGADGGGQAKLTTSRKRWFVLTQHDLVYFVDECCTHYKGTIELSGVDVQEIEGSFNTFVLKTHSKDYYLEAPDEGGGIQGRDAWTFAIRSRTFDKDLAT